MTHWLPYHRDRYFLSMQAALHGGYQSQWSEDDEDKPSDPETVAQIANQKLNSFSSHGTRAVKAYYLKKATKGKGR
ncbi:MAG: hypothetical protein V1912_00110 [bacterium]